MSGRPVKRKLDFGVGTGRVSKKKKNPQSLIKRSSYPIVEKRKFTTFGFFEKCFYFGSVKLIFLGNLGSTLM